MSLLQGGDNPDRPESYHPFYITDNPEGGYGRKSTDERRIVSGAQNGRIVACLYYSRGYSQETIFAGVDPLGGVSSEIPTGVGPLCEFVPRDGGSADSKAQESDTFDDYRNSLDVACETDRNAEFGWVNWTVPEDTPDLVYYQVRRCVRCCCC